VNGEPRKLVAISHRPLHVAQRLVDHGCRWVRSVEAGSAENNYVVRCSSIQKMPRALAGAIPAVLDNVSHWWDTVGSHKWPDDCLEPIAPLPWPTVWAEWYESKRDAYQAALLYECEPTAAHADLTAAGIDLPRDFLSILGQSFRTVVAMPFAWVPGSPCVIGTPPVIWGYDQQRQPIPHPGFPDAWAVCSPPIPGEPPEEIQERVWGELSVWRLFTALLQVKNIDTAETPLPRAFRRRLSRAGGPSWVRYKTLSVHLPARGDHHSSRHPSEIPTDLALHLVRGHFADYRQAPGLFGKYRTRVWVPMHDRGSAEHGAVAKVYDARVRP
jgi:hypothetical protein